MLWLPLQRTKRHVRAFILYQIFVVDEGECTIHRDVSVVPWTTVVSLVLAGHAYAYAYVYVYALQQELTQRGGPASQQPSISLFHLSHKAVRQSSGFGALGHERW